MTSLAEVHQSGADPFADLRLTEWTSCGGCAAKWGASLLIEMVRDMPAGVDPALLVGLAPFDDAAIYQVSPDVALVSTTDFFPPLVDHPSDFGAIAAANACSDVFAMGGRVVVAVNVAAFPEHFPRQAIVAIFDAAAAVVAVSVACGVATAPILLFQFGSVPAYSVIANAIAAPVVAPLLMS